MLYVPAPLQSGVSCCSSVTFPAEDTTVLYDGPLPAPGSVLQAPCSMLNTADAVLHATHCPPSHCAKMNSASAGQPYAAVPLCTAPPTMGIVTHVTPSVGTVTLAYSMPWQSFADHIVKDTDELLAKVVLVLQLQPALLVSVTYAVPLHEALHGYSLKSQAFPGAGRHAAAATRLAKRMAAAKVRRKHALPCYVQGGRSRRSRQ
jgi:hypothetical protein